MTFNQILSAIDFTGTACLPANTDNAAACPEIVTEDDLYATAFDEGLTIAEAGFLDLFETPITSGK